MTAGAVLLAALSTYDAGAGDKKSDAPAPWARVRLGGEIRDLLEVRSKLNVFVLLDRDIKRSAGQFRWDGPPPVSGAKDAEILHVRSMQVADAAWIVVLLDATDKDADALLPKLRPTPKASVPVVFEGALAASRDQDPFVTHANATGGLRIAKNGEPGALAIGQIEVSGELRAGKYEVAKGKTTSLAIANGASPILLTGKGMEGVGQPKAKETITVLGKLIVQKQGPLVVDVPAGGIGTR
jgi:hypothetical protein